MDPALEGQAQRYMLLEDPQRRAIYQFVRAEHGPVTREQAAAGTGVSRSLAAFHLERLLDAGLVTADYARPPGRGGPGSGRPAKRYQVSDAEICIEIPPRRYALAGRLMARAIEENASGESARDTALRLADEEGRRLARDARTRAGNGSSDMVGQCLNAVGFEPVRDESGDVVLANCPFHAFVDAATKLMCSMNQALVGGLLAGLGVDDLEARLAPQDGRCCVVLSHVENATTGVRMRRH